jgi:hypothetical protein
LAFSMGAVNLLACGDQAHRTDRNNLAKRRRRSEVKQDVPRPEP